MKKMMIGWYKIGVSYLCVSVSVGIICVCVSQSTIILHYANVFSPCLRSPATGSLHQIIIFSFSGQWREDLSAELSPGNTRRGNDIIISQILLSSRARLGKLSRKF